MRTDNPAARDTISAHVNDHSQRFSGRTIDSCRLWNSQLGREFPLLVTRFFVVIEDAVFVVIEPGCKNHCA